MDIITFVRNTKATPITELLPKISAYDRSIKTTSLHVALAKLFINHYTGLNERRLVELLRYTNLHYNSMPPTSNVETNMSKIRKELKTKFGYDSQQYNNSLKHLVFSREQKAQNIADYSAKVFARNNNCQPIKVSLINSLLAYGDSDNYKEQIIYLLINSGSRFIELFTGKFKIDKDKPSHIKLSNIAKTRDKDRTISKPLLDKNPEKFLSLLKKIRELNPESTKILINAKLQDSIGETTYFLRKAYANLSYYLLDDKTITKTAFLARILGHEENNEATALSYQSYFIDADEPFTCCSRSCTSP